MQSAPCSSQEGNCNYCWNELVFQQLGLHEVWKVNGLWIPQYERYPDGGTHQLGWYEYCDAFGIPWPYPRLLPDWAIANVDEQHEREVHMDDDLDIEENARKYTYIVLVFACCSCAHSYALVLLLPPPFLQLSHQIQ